MMPCQEEYRVNSFPPAMIIRGEYDFVTEACTRDWRKFVDTGMVACKVSDELRRNFQPDKSMAEKKSEDDTHSTKGANEFMEILMNGCAHYPHFEQPVKYASLIEEFCTCNQP